MVRLKDNPTVSVIIPTYNRAAFLRRSIESILSQTYRDFELIVVDDASTDNTEEVVRSFNDEKIRYIRHKQNSGTSAAPHNTGLKAARGEYIAHQDDDSEWLPQKLDKEMNAFEKASPRVGVVYTAMWLIIDNKRTYFHSPHMIDIMHKEKNIHKAILQRCFVGNQSTLTKKECFDRVGVFDEKLPGCEDWDLWIRVSKYYDFRFIDEPLVTANYSPGASHYSQSAHARGMILVLEKYFQEFKEHDKRLLAERYFNSGAALCINEDTTQFTEGRRSLQKAAKICPLNLEYILASLTSLSGPALFHNRPLHKLLKLYWRFRKSFLE